MREAGWGERAKAATAFAYQRRVRRRPSYSGRSRSGIDPLAARDAALASAKAAAQDAAVKGVTFREAARRYIDGHSAAWRNAKHAAQWGSTIESYVNPVFGRIPVADVATSHVLAALEPIWLTKPETASRLRGRIETILDFAKTREWRSGENPAAWKGHLALTLPARSKVAKVEHHAALPWREIGDFMHPLRNQAGMALGPFASPF